MNVKFMSRGTAHAAQSNERKNLRKVFPQCTYRLPRRRTLRPDDGGLSHGGGSFVQPIYNESVASGLRYLHAILKLPAPATESGGNPNAHFQF